MTSGRGAELRDRPGQEALRAWLFRAFDPDRWTPWAVRRRVGAWMGGTRRRRWAVWTLAAVFVLVVLPAIVGAVATAQTGTVTPTETETTSSAPNSGLSWMGVRDSSGVELSKYSFVTAGASVFHPVDTGLMIVLNLEFAGWSVIVTSAVWLVGWALSFRWLNLFSSALHGVAVNLTGQIATPLLLITAATIGAFFVAYFVVRGFHSKATMQVVSMFGVAIVGTLFLSEPLSEVLSSDGWLAQGRDVGISVAAGLNGNSNPDPTALVETIQTDMADNFARKPLQVWNYGHVVDENPSCKAAWSAGMNSGSSSRVQEGLKSCDSAAYSATRHPTVGQLGAGLILLLAGAVLILFAVYLGLKIIKAAMDAIYHGFMSIFGFAAGGFIYGPTQTFLVRNVVDAFIASGRMAAYTVFLGIYMLFLSDLFRQARGQEMAVFVIGAIVEIIAIFQLHKLSKSLSGGNEWVANRFALAMQGGSAGGSGSGSGGQALGMGQFGASGHAASGLGTMALMTGLNTVASSPLTEWFMGGLPGSIHPQSKVKKGMTKSQGGVWVDEPRFGGARGMYIASYANRLQFGQGFEREAKNFGGVDSVLGVAAGIQGGLDTGAGLGDMVGAHMIAGGKNEERIYRGIRSRQIVNEMAQTEQLKDRDLALLAASVGRAQNSTIDFLNGGRIDEAAVAADYGTLQQAARSYRRFRQRGIDLDEGVGDGAQTQFVRDYMDADLSEGAKNEMITQLSKLSRGEKLDLAYEDGTVNVAGDRLNGMLSNNQVDSDEAQRMLRWITNEHARRVDSAVNGDIYGNNGLMKNVADQGRMRNVRNEVYQAIRTNNRMSGDLSTPALSVTPSSTNPGHENWKDGLRGVANRLS